MPVFGLLCFFHLCLNTKHIFYENMFEFATSFWWTAVTNMLQNQKSWAEDLTNHRDHWNMECQAVERYTLHFSCWFGLFFLKRSFLFVLPSVLESIILIIPYSLMCGWAMLFIMSWGFEWCDFSAIIYHLVHYGDVVCWRSTCHWKEWVPVTWTVQSPGSEGKQHETLYFRFNTNKTQLKSD